MCGKPRPPSSLVAWEQRPDIVLMLQHNLFCKPVSLVKQSQESAQASDLSLESALGCSNSRRTNRALPSSHKTMKTTLRALTGIQGDQSCTPSQRTDPLKSALCEVQPQLVTSFCACSQAWGRPLLPTDRLAWALVQQTPRLIRSKGAPSCSGPPAKPSRPRWPAT